MTKTSQPPRRNSRKSKHRSPWRWAGFVVGPLALAVLVAVSTLSETDDATVEQAIPFELSAADGQTVTLDESLAEGDTLLYFSMGVGCDGCFAQIPELEAAVAERGITFLPIMVDPAPMVASEAARFGIDRPILIDPGAQVSAAYGMVGIYGHGDRPSHSFALVRQSGDIAWVRHYAEMFVPADELLGELDAALGT
ncbi:MAG: redoxin family protein [Acidimicrobiia bacterium]